MAVVKIAIAKQEVALWVVIVGVLGTAWNIFGLIQLADSVMQTQQSLMMKGMTPAAAELYYGLPTWMKLAFALGSGGGLVGSALLVLGSRNAVPVFAASLIGYVALFAGDAAYGVFEVIPGQMAVLSFVVAFAAALLLAGVLARRNLS